MINRKIVLLVDDDKDDIYIFKEAATKYMSAFTFSMACDGREAIHYLVTNPLPDLIFLDLNMPVVNGVECLRWIKGSIKFRHIPVVIFSTSNNPVDIHITRKIGASLFCHKPYNYTELCNKVDILLGSDLPFKPGEQYLL